MTEEKLSIFDSLSMPAADPIFQLTLDFRADPNPKKLDLGVGVFKDAKGETPVLRSVKQAQSRLVDGETSKAYMGLTGYPPFNRQCLELVFGEDFNEARFGALQTPGGAAAVRLLAELVRLGRPNATVWISEETWTPHFTIMDAVGLKWKTYRHYDRKSGDASLSDLLSDLEAASRGDVVLLHGCCQNPTGADFSASEWVTLAKFFVTRDLLPFVDIAYQGFGSGLESDAAGVRILATHVPELLLAYSFSKNFGVYRDRVGCAIVMGSSAVGAKLGLNNLILLARGIYSMPPHHGASVVATVLEDGPLRALWQAELGAMREQIHAARRSFAQALRCSVGDNRFNFVENQRGMFSLLPISPEVVRELRQKHGIYMPSNGRINIAGLAGPAIEQAATALSAALRS